MPHVACHAGEKDVRVSALEPLHLGPRRNSLPLTQVFAQKQAVDLGRVPANDHILIVVRKNCRLREPSRTQGGGKRPCLAYILQGVRLELLPLLPMRLGDGPCAKLDPAILRHPEMPRRRFESEALQLPRSHVVELDQKQGVDDLTPVDLKLPVLNEPLGNLQARRMRPQCAPIAA